MTQATQVGNKFINAATTAGQVLQIVAPSSNTAGLYIRTATLECAPSTGTGTLAVSLYAGPTAPAFPGDNAVRNIMDLYSFNGAGSDARLPYPLFLPAGEGLWFASGGAGGVNITYDLLS